MNSAVVDPNRTGQYVDPDTGYLMMPGSRRPDGTWRKPRRIKEGYVPQEEVPLYESKGKQWAKEKAATTSIPGLSREVMNMKIDTFDSRKLQPAAHIPGLNPNDVILPTSVTGEKAKAKNKKKKAAAVANGNSLSAVNLPDASTATNDRLTDSPASSGGATDPSKKLRNLRKKLRDIEALEAKLKAGEIKTPEPEQLEKVGRKPTVEKEIAELERALGAAS